MSQRPRDSSWFTFLIQRPIRAGLRLFLGLFSYFYFLAPLLALATALCVGYGIGIIEFGEPKSTGSAQFQDWLDWFDRATDLVYEVAQSFTLAMNPRHADETNIWLACGRLFAVVFVFFLSLKAIGLLFRESWHRLSLMLMLPQNVHVVCGLGRIGWRLTDELTTQGQKVIAIENDPTNWHIKLAEQRSAYVIVADARDGEAFAPVPLRRTNKVYIVTGSDEANLQAAIDLGITAQTKRCARWRSRIECYVNVNDPVLEEHVRNLKYSPTRSGDYASGFWNWLFKPVEIHYNVFNVLHDTAEELIVNQLTKIRPRTEEEVGLYVLFGFGDMGRALAVHLVELAHFENLKRSRILILTEAPKIEADRFHSRWGRISPKMAHKSVKPFDARYDDWSENHPHLDSIYQVNDERAIEHAANIQFAQFTGFAGNLAIVTKLKELFAERHVRPAVIFCFDDDDDNYVQAKSFVEAWRATYREKTPEVFAWFPRSLAIKRMVDAESIRPFGHCSDIVTLDRVENPLTERMAIRIYQRYRMSKDFVSLDIDEATQEFYAQPPIFRHSNRMAADHGRIKIQTLGYSVSEKPGLCGSSANFQAVPNALKKRTAQIEHNRYVAERLLAGWRFVPPEEYFGDPQLDRPEGRPYICTWKTLEAMSEGEELEEAKAALKESLSLDLHQIACIWEELQSAGYRLSPSAAR